MSFLIAMPDLVESAAADLAGIRSSLAEAAALAAAPTTGIAAAAQDEVSVAIASMFADFGEQFQAQGALAQAFHAEFVGLLNAGAGAYLSAEVANAEQALLGAVSAPAQALLSGGAAAGLPPSFFNAVTGFGATVAGPYQSLAYNTVTNLQSLGGAITANPTPFLRQFLLNQAGYAQAIATGFQNAVVNLPAELANLPATIQAGIQGLLSFNPVPIVQQLIDQQIGYAQLIATSLQNAGNDFIAGLNALPANLQIAGQLLSSGDITNGLLQVGGSFLAPVFSGLAVTVDPLGNGLLDITPTGALGDLLPILGIPGQMAQNFTNLLPAGSIPRMIAQNATNVFTTLTDLSQTLSIFALNPDLHVGLPLVLAIDAIGAPVTTLEAIGSSATSFFGAVQTGDGLGALAALIDAPAVAANGFLNGHATLGLPASLEGILTITAIPLGGILTPPEFAALNIPLIGPDFTQLSGTSFGGIIPALLTYVPEQLALAIGAPPIS
jgi:hypothetical protein